MPDRFDVGLGARQREVCRLPEGPCEHDRTADGLGRHTGGLGDCIGEDTRERSDADFAEEDPGEELLLCSGLSLIHL